MKREEIQVWYEQLLAACTHLAQVWRWHRIPQGGTGGWATEAESALAAVFLTDTLLDRLGPERPSFPQQNTSQWWSQIFGLSSRGSGPREGQQAQFLHRCHPNRVRKRIA